MRFIDSHCHLNSPELRDDVQGALERAHAVGVDVMALIGSTLADSHEAVDICRRWPGQGLFAVTGVHPHEVKDLNSELPDELLKLAAAPEVRAWGEIGLDYYYDLSPRNVQIDMLVKQLEAAKALDMPVVFHMRDAYEDFWPLMTPERVPEKAELHCFTGSPEDARRALDLGWYFGVTGMITFKKSAELRDVVKALPVESLLCETDSPWLSPVPFRGKVNEPSRVPLIYSALAELKGLSVEDLAAQVWQNNRDFFSLEEEYCSNIV